MSNEVKNERLSPPWYIYHKKLRSLFEEDDQVNIGELEQGPDGQYTAEITVSDKEKQAALQQIILQNVKMGNINITYTFADPQDIPQADDDVSLETFIVAFKENPILVKTATAQTLSGNLQYYAIFKKEVIQFFADNISDYYGNYNGLAVDIAREVLVPTRINYSMANGSE